MMKNMRPLYRKPEEWAILEERTIYNYDTNETPIKVVNVLIGTLFYETEGLFTEFETRRTPITRWVTKKYYDSQVA